MNELVVDTSALFAWLADEPEQPVIDRTIKGAGRAFVSVCSLTELTLAWQARVGPERARDDLERLVPALDLVVMPVATSSLEHLQDAARRYGKGRAAEPAPLNFGDLFAYVLARELALPLLAKGNDFPRTDVRLVPL